MIGGREIIFAVVYAFYIACCLTAGIKTRKEVLFLLIAVLPIVLLMTVAWVLVVFWQPDLPRSWKRRNSPYRYLRGEINWDFCEMVGRVMILDLRSYYETKDGSVYVVIRDRQSRYKHSMYLVKDGHLIPYMRHTAWGQWKKF